MRGLVRHLPHNISASVLLAVVVACSAAGATWHVAKSGSGLSLSNCSSACSSPGQYVAINNHSKNGDDDEKEPAPPVATWDSVTVGLEALYLAPVGAAFWILTRQKRILLTTHMRF